MKEKEEYALRILNSTVDKLDIDTKSKVSLCDEFVKEIRRERKKV